MRLALALAVGILALASAAYVHQRRATVGTVRCGSLGTLLAEGKCYGAGALGMPETTSHVTVTAGGVWDDREAALLILGGIAVAVGILTVRSPSRRGSRGAHDGH